MSLKQPTENNEPNIAEIEKIIGEQGTKPFDVTEVENVKISDKELESFLAWRREVRQLEKEAGKNWRL